jgi:signal transduction histidine kinase
MALGQTYDEFGQERMYNHIVTSKFVYIAPFGILLRLYFLYVTSHIWITLSIIIFDYILMYLMRYFTYGRDKINVMCVHFFWSWFQLICPFLYQYFTGPGVEVYLISYLSLIPTVLFTLNENSSHPYLIIASNCVSSYWLGEFSVKDIAIFLAPLMFSYVSLDLYKHIVIRTLHDLYDRDVELEKDKVKAKFLATASHELRNPLQGLLFLLSILEMEDLSDVRIFHDLTIRKPEASSWRVIPLCWSSIQM